MGRSSPPRRELLPSRGPFSDSFAPGNLLCLLHIGLVALLLVETSFVRERFDTDRFICNERFWSSLLLATLAVWFLVGVEDARP